LHATFGATSTHGEILDDAILDVVEAVMIRVENGSGRDDVGLVGRRRVPRQIENGVEPRSDPTGFGTLVARAFQLPDLAECRLAYLLREVG
jgi:hypothetical protein